MGGRGRLHPVDCLLGDCTGMRPNYRPILEPTIISPSSEEQRLTQLHGYHVYFTVSPGTGDSSSFQLPALLFTQAPAASPSSWTCFLTPSHILSHSIHSINSHGRICYCYYYPRPQSQGPGQPSNQCMLSIKHGSWNHTLDNATIAE